MKIISQWYKKPIASNFAHDSSDYILSLDESGLTEMNNISDSDNNGLRWFTLCGVIIKKSDLKELKKNVTTLKNEYWEEGLYKNNRVVFHSRDIRQKNGPFSPKIINYDKFLTDLQNLIESVNFEIISSSIDKFHHSQKYGLNSTDPYSLCIEFILERYCFFLRNNRSEGELLLERRTPYKDATILEKINLTKNNGTYYVESQKFDCILCAHFNKKLTHDRKKSYFLLEIADIVAYEIAKFTKTNKKTDLFKSLESKIVGYPKYIGKGMKVFPVVK